MEPKITLKPKLSTEELRLKQKEQVTKERDATEEARKSKFFYHNLEQVEKEDDDDDFFEVLDKIKQENDVLAILKWLKSNFEEALQQSKVNSNTENFCYSQPEEWKEILNGENFTKLVKVLDLEVKKMPGNLVIPVKVLSFGLSYIDELIDEIIISSPKVFVCQVCNKRFNVLAQHLNKAKSCKENYSKSDLEEFEYAQKLWKKKTFKDCYERDKESKAKSYQERKSDISKKYLANRKEATQKMAEYYQKNKSTFKTKNAQYYAKNREEILKRKAEQYKTKKARKN